MIFKLENVEEALSLFWTYSTCLNVPLRGCPSFSDLERRRLYQLQDAIRDWKDRSTLGDTIDAPLLLEMNESEFRQTAIAVEFIERLKLVDPIEFGCFFQFPDAFDRLAAAVRTRLGVENHANTS